MGEVIAGRQTAAYDGEVVVFLIGMRVNSLIKVREWMPVFRAMGPMLRELMKDKEGGLLEFRTLPTWRGVTLIQYWESVEKLQAFANDTGRTHRPAWVEYFRNSFKSGAVGIWHETYVVPAGNTETIYGNMPLLGLGWVKSVEPVNKRTETAADRLHHRED
ncbi:uncharacterized protein DUF4188 [Kribbella pratensis]|uniref:Uncharacterized protein DUF4188 n=1 Tax=Kribbella pratensis TaxID=2512112 RepID=A0ABY2FE22_9ACTN|nr:DUF4188 domain-containing protein [Kribbella pratensis]TDW89611.1 uncharacterized protein DUF4188 [Kribbella pratensis]